LAEGLLCLIPPWLGLILLECELLEAVVSLQELSHSVQAIVTDNADMKLLNMFVLINGFDKTIETGFL
jgi:hypothetical protein